MTGRRRELGFGPPVELMFFVAAIALATAAWLPQLAKRDVRRGRHACARMLDAMVAGGERSSCPVSGAAIQPRQLYASSPSYEVRCPTPEAHQLPAGSRELVARTGLTATSAAEAFPPPMPWPKVIAGWLATVVGAVVMTGFLVTWISRAR